MLGSFAVRRTRSAWLLVGSLTVTVLVTSALVSALVSFYATALPATVSAELARSGTMSMAISGNAGARPAAQAARVAARLAAAFGRLPFRIDEATWSDDLAVPVPARAGQVPVVVAAAVGGLTASADLTAGRWPGAPRPGAPIPAALPASAARDLGVRLGSVLRLRDLSAGTHVSLVVTGLFRPRQPASPYWRIGLIGPSGVAIGGGFASYGPAVVSPAVLAGNGAGVARLKASQQSFVVLPRVASIRPADLTSLARRLSAAVMAIDSQGQLTARTAMPQTLANVAAGLAAARSLVVISGLQLLLLACAALALASRLLASYREEQGALLAARGAARWQLIAPSLAEATVAVLASAAAGTIAGSWLSAVLVARLTGQPRALAPGATVWLGAALLSVLCIGIVVWPSAWLPRPGEARIRRGRSAPVAAAVAAGGDVALIVLAVLAVQELRSYAVTAQVASGSGLDPVIAVAPVLALAGLAIVPLRLLPLAAKGLERLTARSRRLGSAMASWEISRRPVRQSGPALLVILAVGASTLALAQYQSWWQSVHDQAAFAVGARVQVEPPQPEPLGGVARIARLPGVTAAMPVSRAPAGPGQLLVLDAGLAARTVTLRPDLSSRPLGQLFAAITTRSRPGIVLPGRPARLELTASMTGPAGLGPVSATLTVQDADGVGYALQTSDMPADGRPHALVAPLGAAGAAYPLRLIGMSVNYQMPSYPPSVTAGPVGQPAVLRLDGISVSPVATGPFARPFAAGRVLAAWRPRAADPWLAAQLVTLGGATDGAVRPAIASAGPADGAEQIRFDPGRGPLIPGSRATQPGLAELDVDIPAAARPVPVIATDAFAAANDLRLGTVLPLTVAGASISGQVVATVSAFPGDGVLVAGQAAVQDALASQGDGGTLPVTAWWLATATGEAPPGLPAGSVVTAATTLARRLEHDPLSAAPVQAAVAVAAAAALLAALGFCVSVAASARERRPQRALLGALGVPSGPQAGLFCLEEAMISIPAAVVGLAIGVGLARLVVPALTLTATGGLPVPPVLVAIPLGWVAVIAAGLPAIPVVAAAVSALRQPDAAAELRAAEAAV